MRARIWPPHWLTSARLHAALIHAALLLFGLDLLGQAWPWFGSWWENKAHFVVAVAAFLESFGEASLIYAGHKLKQEIETATVSAT